jgi:hypothetical protein
VPGPFEREAPPAAVPPGVEAGPLRVDRHATVESAAQEAPEAPLDERIANLFAAPQAQGAPERRGDGFAGYVLERALADGGSALLASLVGERSHLIVKIVTAPGGEPDVARRIWESILPDRPSGSFFAV